MAQCSRGAGYDPSASSTWSAWSSGLTSRKTLPRSRPRRSRRSSDRRPCTSCRRTTSRPRPVVLRDLVLGVGEKRERQVELLLELRRERLAVGAHAEHDCAGALELAPGVADPARLRRAARRVVLGIEVEDDRLPSKSASETASPVSLGSVNVGAGWFSSTGNAGLLRRAVPASRLSARLWRARHVRQPGLPMPKRVSRRAGPGTSSDVSDGGGHGDLGVDSDRGRHRGGNRPDRRGVGLACPTRRAPA